MSARELDLMREVLEEGPSGGCLDLPLPGASEAIMAQLIANGWSVTFGEEAVECVWCGQKAPKELRRTCSVCNPSE